MFSLLKPHPREDFLPTGNSPGPRPAHSAWYAIYTASRHEKRVAQHFELQQVDHYLPLYSARRRWKNGLTVDLDLPLFPGYLFAHFAPGKNRTRILQVPGVISIVGGRDGHSAAIPDAIIAELKRGVDLRLIEPHCGIPVGHRVHIHSGLFAGARGILVRRKNEVRVVIAINEMMQRISVEVDETVIEPCPADEALVSHRS